MRSLETNKRQWRQRQVSRGRVTTLKALPENSQQMLCVLRRHHIVLLFPIISVADGFESLVTVLPRGSWATYPPGWSLNKTITQTDFEQKVLQSPFVPYLQGLGNPGLGVRDAVHEESWHWVWCGCLVIHFGLRKSVIRKVNSSIHCWLRGRTPFEVADFQGWGVIIALQKGADRPSVTTASSSWPCFWPVSS